MDSLRNSNKGDEKKKNKRKKNNVIMSNIYREKGVEAQKIKIADKKIKQTASLENIKLSKNMPAVIKNSKHIPKVAKICFFNK